MENAEKQTAEATPRPWELADDRWPPVLYSPEAARSICTVDDWDDFKEADANARLIVRAVNAHEGLVEAVRYVLNDVPAPGEDAQLTREGYNRLSAALAKAKGEDNG